MVIFIVSIVFIPLEQKTNLNRIKEYAKIKIFLMLLFVLKTLKVRDHCHYTGEYSENALSICNLKYNLPKRIPIVFHNGSNYDYHFIIKELAE